MTKVIILSIQSQHAVNILKGFKTEELRKSVPKGFRGWVYIYVTLKRPVLINKNYISEFYEVLDTAVKEYKKSAYQDEVLNGKVVARFWFDEYDTLTYEDFWDRHDYIANDGEVGWEVDSDYIKLFCLDYQDILDYGFREKPYRHQVDLYAWHIKQLEVFDTPKRLGEFYVTNKGLTYKYIKEYEDYTNDEVSFRLKKAPQKMVLVYAKELENE